MPRMDGTAFLEALGERGKLEELPVIIVNIASLTTCDYRQVPDLESP
jgi:CheY-like chemotaxis protein